MNRKNWIAFKNKFFVYSKRKLNNNKHVDIRRTAKFNVVVSFFGGTEVVFFAPARLFQFAHVQFGCS